MYKSAQINMASARKMETLMPDAKFQFERLGYFVADQLDHAAGKPVFNFAVGLKDSFGK